MHISTLSPNEQIVLFPASHVWWLASKSACGFVRKQAPTCSNQIEWFNLAISKVNPLFMFRPTLVKLYQINSNCTGFFQTEGRKSEPQRCARARVLGHVGPKNLWLPYPILGIESVWLSNTHRIHGAAIYANIGGILMVNVTIYSIHGSYGIIKLSYFIHRVSYRTFFFFIIFVLKCIEYLWANEKILHSPEIIIRPFWVSPNTMIPGFFVSTWDHLNLLMDAGCAKTMAHLTGA